MNKNFSIQKRFIDDDDPIVFFLEKRIVVIFNKATEVIFAVFSAIGIVVQVRVAFYATGDLTAGAPQLTRPPRPGPCLHFGFQYSLVRSNRSKS